MNEIECGGYNNDCVCRILEEKEILPSYLFESCYESHGKKVLVSEVCPRYATNAQKICHLTGCENKLVQQFKTVYLPPMIVVGCISTFAFSAALIFILQITHNFRKNSLQDDLTQVQPDFFRNKHHADGIRNFK